MCAYVTFLMRNLSEAHVFSNRPGLKPGLHSSIQKGGFAYMGKIFP